MDELRNVPQEAGSSIVGDLKLRCPLEERLI